MSIPMLKTSSSEQDRSLEFLNARIRLMIIELGKYSKIEELLIENRTTGSQGHVCYQDRD